MKILQKSCIHLFSTEPNQVCTESLLTLVLSIMVLQLGKLSESEKGKNQASNNIKSFLESTPSISHALSFTPHSELYELYEVGTLRPFLYMGHRGYFPKVYELLSGETGPGPWVFLSLCPPSLDSTTAQVSHSNAKGYNCNAGEESKAQH